jgi:hypothetical protein
MTVLADEQQAILIVYGDYDYGTRMNQDIAFDC